MSNTTSMDLKNATYLFSLFSYFLFNFKCFITNMFQHKSCWSLQSITQLTWGVFSKASAHKGTPKCLLHEVFNSAPEHLLCWTRLGVHCFHNVHVGCNAWNFHGFVENTGLAKRWFCSLKTNLLALILAPLTEN